MSFLPRILHASWLFYSAKSITSLFFISSCNRFSLARPLFTINFNSANTCSAPDWYISAALCLSCQFYCLFIPGILTCQFFFKAPCLWIPHKSPQKSCLLAPSYPYSTNPWNKFMQAMFIPSFTTTYFLKTFLQNTFFVLSSIHSSNNRSSMLSGYF